MVIYTIATESSFLMQAYNLDTTGGAVGDYFLDELESFAAYTPTMVTMGNHEAANEFEHFSQRFQNMPASNGSIMVVHATLPLHFTICLSDC